MKCQKCGAECPPGTSFCRQCGAPVDTGAIRASEQTTALLDETDGVMTHRLESRETGRNRGAVRQSDGAHVAETRASNRRALLIAAVVIVVIGLISIAGFMALRSHKDATANLIYPGSRTVLDMKSEDGTRVLQLQTSDPVSEVEVWYQKAMKSEKIVRVTPNNIVLKNEKALATIVAEGNTTNILIKQSK